MSIHLTNKQKHCAYNKYKSLIKNNVQIITHEDKGTQPHYIINGHLPLNYKKIIVQLQDKETQIPKSNTLKS